MSSDWNERGKVTPLRSRRALSLSFQAELYRSETRGTGQIMLCLLVPWQDRHAVAPIADLAGQTLAVEIRAQPEEETE